MEKQYCDNTCALIGIWKASSVKYWDRDEHGVSDHWITVFDDDTTFDTVVFDVDGTYTSQSFENGSSVRRICGNWKAADGSLTFDAGTKNETVAFFTVSGDTLTATWEESDGDYWIKTESTYKRM